MSRKHWCCQSMCFKKHSISKVHAIQHNIAIVHLQKNMILPLFMSKTWYYHSTYPENMVLSWYVPQKHNINKVHAIKLKNVPCQYNDITMVHLQKTWYYHTCPEHIGVAIVCAPKNIALARCMP